MTETQSANSNDVDFQDIRLEIEQCIDDVDFQDIRLKIEECIEVKSTRIPTGLTGPVFMPKVFTGFEQGKFVHIKDLIYKR